MRTEEAILLERSARLQGGYFIALDFGAPTTILALKVLRSFEAG